MDTLKSLSLLAVCVVAGVVLFALRGGVGDAGHEYIITTSKIFKDALPQGELVFKIDQENEKNPWVIGSVTEGLSCTAESVLKVVQGADSKAKTLIKCDTVNFSGLAKVVVSKKLETDATIMLTFNVV